MSKKKTCLVAGGAGFIGSHMVRRLLKDGYKVICVDNLCTGSKDNIKDLMDNPDFKFLEHDIKEKLAIDGPVDYIFNLASRASPIDFSKFPLDILITNSRGTHNLLNIAKEKGARFLEASTSEVYGDPKEHPQKETYWGNVNPRGERSCYDESKRFSEALCMAFYNKFGVDVRIARIFNTYGPNMRKDDGRVVPNFITQALEGKPLTIYGDGKQTRSFCFVEDEVDGLLKLMFKEGISGDVFNIGNPGEFTMLELAEKVKEITGNTSELVFKDLPEDDPEKRRPDITKAKEVLGWEPKVLLDEGLRKTIEYFKGLKS